MIREGEGYINTPEAVAQELINWQLTGYKGDNTYINELCAVANARLKRLSLKLPELSNYRATLNVFVKETSDEEDIILGGRQALALSLIQQGVGFNEVTALLKDSKIFRQLFLEALLTDFSFATRMVLASENVEDENKWKENSGRFLEFIKALLKTEA